MKMNGKEAESHPEGEQVKQQPEFPLQGTPLNPIVDDLPESP